VHKGSCHYSDGLADSMHREVLGYFCIVNLKQSRIFVTQLRGLILVSALSTSE
jgi:hypothetical protein